MPDAQKYCRNNIPLYVMGNVDGKMFCDVTDLLAKILDRSGFVLKPFVYGTPAPMIEKTSCGCYVLKDENGKRVFTFETIEEFEEKIKRHFHVFLK